MAAKATSLQLLLSPGTVFMPPKWSLGYQQCRWSYLSDQRVLEVLGAIPIPSPSIVTSLGLIAFTYVESLSWRCWIWHVFQVLTAVVIVFFSFTICLDRKKKSFLSSIWCACILIYKISGGFDAKIALLCLLLTKMIFN